MSKCESLLGTSAAPGIVKSILTVDVQRPRNLKSMSDPDFIRCVEKIRDLLHYEAKKVRRENSPARMPTPPRESRRRFGLFGRD